MSRIYRPISTLFRLKSKELFVHAIEEVIVVLGITQLVEQEFHAVLNTHRIQDPAENPHL